MFRRCCVPGSSYIFQDYAWPASGSLSWTGLVLVVSSTILASMFELLHHLLLYIIYSMQLSYLLLEKIFLGLHCPSDGLSTLLFKKPIHWPLNKNSVLFFVVGQFSFEDFRWSSTPNLTNPLQSTLSKPNEFVVIRSTIFVPMPEKKSGQAVIVSKEGHWSCSKALSSCQKTHLEKLIEAV